MRFIHDVKLTPLQIAEAFCELNDEQQAQVFIEAARIAEQWQGPGFISRDYQWSAVGRHLRTCACSTDEAREMVREIAVAIEEPSP